MFTPEFLSQLAGAVSELVVSQMASQGAVTQRLFSVAEAGVYLGRSPKAIEHMIARGTVQVTKLDGKRQIDKATLDKLISERTYYEA